MWDPLVSLSSPLPLFLRSRTCAAGERNSVVTAVVVESNRRRASISELAYNRHGSGKAPHDGGGDSGDGGGGTAANGLLVAVEEAEWRRRQNGDGGDEAAADGLLAAVEEAEWQRRRWRRRATVEKAEQRAADELPARWRRRSGSEVGGAAAEHAGLERERKERGEAD
uniref:DUF834 domain-containing protein n=1 Tax=Oryza meridionalis TaxID=40149 RepID=A0A0E0EA03_9ORYZ